MEHRDVKSQITEEESLLPLLHNKLLSSCQIYLLFHYTHCVFSNFQAVSGLISDARQIVETARTEASNYRSQYQIPVPLKYLNERVSMYMHAYTLYSAVRPYGCSVVMGTWSEHDGPQMYMLDPSGVSFVSILLL